MRRIGLAVLFTLGLLVAPSAVVAQQKAMPVIGYLSQRSPTDSASIVAAFRQGLQEELLHDRDGALAHERDRHRIGSARRGARRSGRRGRR